MIPGRSFCPAQRHVYEQGMERGTERITYMNQKNEALEMRIRVLENENRLLKE